MEIQRQSAEQSARQSVKHMLMSVRPKQKVPTHKKSLFKVPSRIRNQGAHHYNAVFVSMGLYDRPPTLSGDGFRFQMVVAFLKDLGRTAEYHWDNVCEAVVGDPAAMRELYKDGESENLSEEDTTEFLALDAIFLVSVLIVIANLWGRDLSQPLPKLANCKSTAEENQTELHTFVAYDILRLENQIPTLLIKKVIYFMCKYIPAGEWVESTANRTAEVAIELQNLHQPGEASFSEFEASPRVEAILHCIYANFINHTRYFPLVQTIGHPLLQNCEHILHCVAFGVLESASPSEQRKDGTVMSCLLSSARWLGLISSSGKCLWPGKRQQPTQSNHLFHLPRAKELIKSGIKFKRQSGIIPRFKRHPFNFSAVLYLPEMQFGDTTETCWKNLLAFEDEYMDKEVQHFKSFLWFMDDLIDTGEYVELLRKGRNSPISFNFLGNDSRISILLNSMLTNYALRPSDSYDPKNEWTKIRTTVVSYHNNRLRQSGVEFWSTHFGKPWGPVSLFAAAIVVVGTVIQATFSTLDYFGH